MHRRPLLELLDDYAVCYPEELATVGRIRSLVESNSDCFERTCRPGHITASAWVISPERRRCLLVHHRKLGRWLQPGGHADGDPNVAAVAMREATEETGLTQLELVSLGPTLVPLDLDVHEIPERRAADGSLVEDTHEHHDLRFLLEARDEAPIIVSDESHDARWFSAEQLREVTTEESVLRLHRKAIELLRIAAN